jgi:hypothetical protein
MSKFETDKLALLFFALFVPLRLCASAGEELRKDSKKQRAQRKRIVSDFEFRISDFALGK